MLSEKNQSQKTTYCVTPFTGNDHKSRQIYVARKINACWGLGEVGEGKHKKGEYPLMRLEFSFFFFWSDKNVSKLDSGDGCILNILKATVYFIYYLLLLSS